MMVVTLERSSVLEDEVDCPCMRLLADDHGASP